MRGARELPPNQKEPHLRHGNRHHSTAHTFTHTHTPRRQRLPWHPAPLQATGSSHTISLNSSQDTQPCCPSLLLHFLAVPSNANPDHSPLISRGQGLLSFLFLLSLFCRERKQRWQKDGGKEKLCRDPGRCPLMQRNRRRLHARFYPEHRRHYQAPAPRVRAAAANQERSQSVSAAEGGCSTRSRNITS